MILLSLPFLYMSFISIVSFCGTIHLTTKAVFLLCFFMNFSLNFSTVIYPKTSRIPVFPVFQEPRDVLWSISHYQTHKGCIRRIPAYTLSVSDPLPQKTDSWQFCMEDFHKIHDIADGYDRKNHRYRRFP